MVSYMNYTTYLRWGVLASIFLVLFVPFVVSSGTFFPSFFFPYITGKNFIFRILVELGLLCYILLALREPKYRPKSSLIMWAALALVAWMGLATITSVDPIKSFWSNFERMDGYINLLHLFVWFVITGAVLSASNLWEKFIYTSIGASIVQGLFALFQVLHLFGMAPSSQSGARADTTFGNATYLAVYMLFNIFFTLFMLARAAGERRLSSSTQALFGLALVLQFFALYATETRGAFLGAIGGLIVAALYLAIFGRGHKALRRWALYGLGALAVLIAVFIGVRDTSFIKNSSTLNRIASISLNDTTVQSRLLYIWPTALKGISEKPITGWGQENFSYVFNTHYQPAMYNQEQWFDRAHNQFLDFGIAGGVPALLLYLALFVLAAWAAWRSKLSVLEAAVIVGLLAAYGFNNLFVFDNLVSFVYFFALLAYLHSLSRKELHGWMFLSRPISEQGLAIAAPVVIIVIAVGGWALNAPGMARAGVLVQALQQQSSPQGNFDLFQKSLGTSAWPGNPLGFQEAVEQLAQFASTNVSSSSVDPSVKQQFLTLSSASLQQLMAQRPHDARLELFMGTLLSQFGANNEAVDFLKLALADSPGKQQILMQLGLVQIQLGQSIDAIATFRTAFEEAPDYEAARILYAGAYFAAGDVARGDAILSEKWGSPIVDNDQLLQVYINTKQWSRAIAIWQMRVDKDPNNVETHLGLASMYFQAGDNEKTIAELQKVSQLNPALAAQMQQLITQIQSGTLKP